MKIFRNDIAIVMGGQIVQLAIAVVTSTIIARSLSSDGYGVVNLLRSSFITILTISPLGLDIALLKYCGRGEADDPLKEATVSRLRLIAFAASLVLVAGVGILAGSGWLHHIYSIDGIEALSLVTFLALPFATDTALINALYRARGRVARYTLRVAYFQSAFRIVVVPLATWLAPTITTFIWINTVQIILSAGLLLLDLRRQSRRASTPEARVVAAKLNTEVIGVLRESFWMCLSVFIYSLMRSADVLFLGAYAPGPGLGVYAALSMVAQLIAVFPLAASQSLGPNISSAYHAGDMDRVKRELNAYLQKAVPFSAFIFGGIAIFGQRLDLVFGPSFHFDWAICLLLPLGQMLSATLAPMGYSLSMTGHHRAENAILTLGGAVLLLLCAVLVPRFGPIGAASAVAFAFLFVNVARFLLVIRVIGAVPGRWLDFLPAPVSIALAFAALWTSDSTVGQSLTATLFGCVIYTVLFGLATTLFFLDKSSRDRLAKLVLGGTRA